MTFAKRFYEVRKSRNLTLGYLAKNLNEKYKTDNNETPFHKSNFSKWEKQGVDPSLSKIAKVSEYLNVSLDYLAGLDERKKFPVVEIPVYNKINIKNNSQIYDYKYIPNNSKYANDNIFYLKVKKTTSLVNKDKELKNGNIGLFLLPNSDEATICKAQMYDNNILLTNEEGEQNLYSFDEVVTIGIVVSKEIEMI